MELTRRAFCNLAAGGALSLGVMALAAETPAAQAATFTLASPQIALSNCLDGAKCICFNEGRAILSFDWDGHNAVGLADKQGNVIACYVCEENNGAPLASQPFQNGSFAFAYGNTVRTIDASGGVAHEATLPDGANVVGIASDSVCYGIKNGGSFSEIAFSIFVPSTSTIFDLDADNITDYGDWPSYSRGLGGWNGWSTSCERGMGVYALQQYAFFHSFIDYYLAQREGAHLEFEGSSSTAATYFFDESYYPVKTSVGNTGITATLATYQGEMKELSNTDFATRYSGSDALLFTKEGLAFGTTKEDPLLGRTEDANFFVWNLETNELTWAPTDYDSRIDWDAVKAAQPPLYDGGRLALPLKGDDGNTYVAMFDETFSPVREPVRGDCDEAVDGYPTVFSVTQGSAYSGFNSGRLIVRHGTSCHDEGALRGQDVTVYDSDGQVVFEVSGQDCYMFGDYHDGLALYVSTADPDTLSFVDTSGAVAFTGFDTSNATVMYI